MTSLNHLADALKDVPGVTDANLAGSGYDLRKANVHTSAPPDAPQDVRFKSTGMSGQMQSCSARWRGRCSTRWNGRSTR